MHNGILLNHKKKEILPFDNMDKLEDIKLSELCQAHKEIWHDFAHWWHLKMLNS